MRDQKLFLAEDAIEVAFWEPPAAIPTRIEVEQLAESAALVAVANAALEHVVEEDENAEADTMLLDDGGFPESAFEFDPDLELGDFVENFLDNPEDMAAMTTFDSAMDDCSSMAGSKSSPTSVEASAKSSKDETGSKKKKAKKPIKSSPGSVADSITSIEESEKKEKAEKKKAEKKKDSPSSLAESVMSTKSGKGDKSKPKKPVKPKVKKEPEPEKTWAFVRMETVSI